LYLCITVVSITVDHITVYELIDYFGMTISFTTVCTQAKRN